MSGWVAGVVLEPFRIFAAIDAAAAPHRILKHLTSLEIPFS